jgi:hypothetical protein
MAGPASGQPATMSGGLHFGWVLAGRSVRDMIQTAGT